MRTTGVVACSVTRARVPPTMASVPNSIGPRTRARGDTAAAATAATTAIGSVTSPVACGLSPRPDSSHWLRP